MSLSADELGRVFATLAEVFGWTTRPSPEVLAKIVALAELAAEFAREVLAPGGAFVAKVLQGGTEGQLLADLKRDFAVVRHVKPAASRADSAELYVLATGFRGTRTEGSRGLRDQP